MVMIEQALDFLLPSWWEIKVTLAASLFVISSFWFFAWSGSGGDIDAGGGDRSLNLEISGNSGDGIDDKDKMGQFKGDHQANSAYIIKLELLAAKNLIGANLNGTSDPYAIITCGSEKRFSSMVPGSRNPMWGEEFNFSVDELPVQITERTRKMCAFSSLTILSAEEKISLAKYLLLLMLPISL